MNRDDDTSRQGTSRHDNIRDAEAVTWQDSTTYSMALPQVYARFVEAGLNRSLRTLQRYCEQGHLRAAKYPTETGAVWYVDPDSVETKIEEIRQVQETMHRPATPSNDDPLPTTNDMPRHDADRRHVTSSEINNVTSDIPATTRDDEPRQQNDDVVRRANDTATNQSDVSERQSTPVDDDKYVTVPVVILDALTEQLAAKDEQIRRRDQQMERLIETHDKDRQLLGAALAIIHRDDFAMELGEGEVPDKVDEPAPAAEIKPQFGQERGNPQPPHQASGV